MAQALNNYKEPEVNRSLLQPSGETVSNYKGVEQNPVFNEKRVDSPDDTSPTMNETAKVPEQTPVTPAVMPQPTPETGVAPKPTSVTTDTAQATSAKAKETVETILKDPYQYIKDNKLEQKYTEGKVLDEEIMDPNKNTLGPTGELVASTVGTPDKVVAESVKQTTGTAADPVKVKDFEVALIDPASLKKAVDELAKVDPMKAASMAKHMDGLLVGLESGNIPLWARPAVTKVEQMLASRGISASSIGRDSLFNAIIQAAMPIAQQDATFEQDANKTNYNAKVQAILTDVNNDFAAKQFNATSINQANQFKAQLSAQVEMQNASRKDAMSQFNAGEANKLGMFDAGNKLAADQFNVQTSQQAGQFNASQVNAMAQASAQLNAQREQFNAQMTSQIEQSNVNWRRQVNQQNTAGINAVNQANVQNAFNLSNQALTFLWQEMRDKAHWEFQASESDKDRKNQLEATLLASETAMGGEIGKTLENLINGGKFLTSFLDNWKK